MDNFPRSFLWRTLLDSRVESLYRGSSCPGWRRSRCRTSTGCSLSRNHRQSWRNGRRRNRARSRMHERRETLKQQCACPWMGWLWDMLNVMWTRQTMQLQTACNVLNAAWSAYLRALRHSRCCPQWCQDRWECACSRAPFVVAICRHIVFVNFLYKRY